MREQTVIIPKGGQLTRIVALLSALVRDVPLKVTIAEYKRTRSLEQNALPMGRGLSIDPSTLAGMGRK